MHLNKLVINKFRGINSLEIDDFKRVNLIVGKNNSCKTSLLEAIFLLVGISNPQLPLRIDNLRKISQNKSEDFSYIFYNLNSENKLNIRGEFSEGNERTLNIIPNTNKIINEKNNETFEEDTNNDFDTNYYSNSIRGLILNFDIKEAHKSKQSYKSSIINQGNNIMSLELPKNYTETFKGAYIHSNLNFLNMSKRLERLIISKKQKLIVECLKNIDSSIKDISLGTGGMIYIDIGIDKLVPLNIIGDGIQKLLNLILTIIDTPNGFVLVDEIENGLYYSALKVLWKAVIELSEEYNVQLFITTHNLETLKYLKDVLENPEMEKYKNDIRSFTLRKLNDNIIKPYKYNFESFEYSLEQGIEIR